MDKSKTCYFVLIEEELNKLLQDEKIRKIRTALVDFVTERLRERMLIRIKKAGLHAKTEQHFLAGETDTLYKLLEEQKELLGLSQAQMREFRRIAKLDRKVAWHHLMDMLLEEEKLCFRKEAGFTAKVWLSFLNHSALPGEATLEKIRIHLTLTPEQQQEFERRIIRYVFWVDHTLREKVHSLRRQTGLSVSDFLTYALVGKEAWESFYPIEDESYREKKTSQDTLLKLVIGFGLDETGAWDFMDAAKSAFAVRKDLVVLSCIRRAYTNPIQVQEILDFFAEGKHGERYYTNPYG